MPQQAKTGDSSNPIITSRNRLKLGVFGVNVSSGCAMTDMPDTIKVEWDESVAIALAAEDAGIEAMVPVARWRGMGGTVNFNHRNFDPFTWAAGLAAKTERIALFSTFHIPTVHPVRAAKEVATIDHISGGRFCLNMVAGWNDKEIAMFGAPQRAHDERYDVADDWISACKELWTKQGTFQYDGGYFQIPDAYGEPKPVQRPWPVLMSAGNSPRGQHFAAKHTDLNFVAASSVEKAGIAAKEVKKLARETYNRDIQVFSQAYIICRDTEKEARDYYDYYVHEKGDWEGARNLLDVLIPNSQSSEWEALAENMIAGYGALPLIGTPDQVADGLQAFADNGLDGLTLSWVNYPDGLKQFKQELLPRLVEKGLREG